jgi:REP element-mobilizing transposase RayT
MPRFARMVYPGGIYHIISRMFNREYLIKRRSERLHYLELVGAAFEKSDAVLLAWCIMTSQS